MIQIRQATLADLPVIYDICAKTALDGSDARSQMSDDQKVGHYFAAPYLHYDLAGCFVLCEQNTVKGYILGAANSQKYTNWLNQFWLKQVRPLYAIKPIAVSGFDEFLNSVIFSDAVLDARFNDFPAHFHIDILPELQRQGFGKKLIQHFCEYCRSESVHKLHLMVSSNNLKALSFYKYLGFAQLFAVEGAIALGYEF